MDSYFLKLTGKAELPKGIEIGHNFRVLAEGSIVSEEISDNEDGFKNHGYKFQPVKLEAITEIGETIKAKDTRSNSRLWRAQMFAKWKEAETEMTADEFYDFICNWERRNADFIISAALKEKK